MRESERQPPPPPDRSTMRYPACILVATLAPISSAQVFNPANGNHYEVVFQATDWDTADSIASSMTFMGVQGHLATVSSAAEDQFVYYTANGGSPIGNCWLGAKQNMNSPTYTEPSGGWEWVTGEPWGVYTNWYANEPNNSGGAEHHLGYWPGDQWNDYNPASTNVGVFVVEYDTGMGVPYCSVTANSGGTPAMLSTSGSNSISANNLVLSAAPVPDEPGLFYYGPSQVQVPFGNGFRCVSGPLGRLALGTGSSGVLTHQLDNAQPPNVSTIIASGTTWNFQAWYMDANAGGAGFNLSSALEVMFVP